MRKIHKIVKMIVTLSSLGLSTLVSADWWVNMDSGTANLDETVFGKDTLTMEEILKDKVKDNLQGVSKAESLFDLIMGWISFFLPYAGLFAFVGILYAGFLYLTGFANEENIEKAKKILMWSIIGLILIFMAYAIVSTFIKPTG